VSRLANAFAAQSGRTGLIPYLTAGYPTLPDSLELMRRFADAGVRAIEVGVPFSDPIADGAEIQRASEWAVRRGVDVSDVLGLVREFRTGSPTPVVIMTYANPIVRYGLERFAADAVSAGVDGVLVSDLPADESPEWWEVFDRAGIDTVALVAPTTPPARLPAVLARCRGFVYCLSRTGVTGRGGGESGALDKRLVAVRTHTQLPIAIGFGIASPDDARPLKGRVDAVVVGAAFMRAIAEDTERGGPERAARLAHAIVQALD
jgi:tryptophan synthase alpha chain